jgi:hypothetical protein
MIDGVGRLTSYKDIYVLAESLEGFEGGAARHDGGRGKFFLSGRDEGLGLAQVGQDLGDDLVHAQGFGESSGDADFDSMVGAEGLTFAQGKQVG